MITPNDVDATVEEIDGAILTLRKQRAEYIRLLAQGSIAASYSHPTIGVLSQELGRLAELRHAAYMDARGLVKTTPELAKVIMGSGTHWDPLR